MRRVIKKDLIPGNVVVSRSGSKYICAVEQRESDDWMERIKVYPLFGTEYVFVSPFELYVDAKVTYRSIHKKSAKSFDELMGLVTAPRPLGRGF